MSRSHPPFQRVSTLLLPCVAGLAVLSGSCQDAVAGGSGAGAGAGPSPAADGTQAKIDLGNRLMFDERLSIPTGMACGTCHDPLRGWGDARPQGKGVQDNTLATGSHDPALAVAGNLWKTVPLPRNTPTIYNAHLFPNQFWDKRAGDLAHQANFPVDASTEMNSSWPNHILPLLESDPTYVAMFAAAFGPSAINQANAVAAIGAFEQTISVFDTPYDKFLAGDSTALTADQVAGKDLFFGPAGCFNCHPAPLLTDFSQHNTGVPNAGILALNGEIDFGFGKRNDLTQDPPVLHDDPQDYCKFKTPQLRMVAVTKPFMHNGAFDTLEEVVDFYDQGGGPDLSGTGTKTGILVPLNLTATEKTQLVEFLRNGLRGSEIR